MRGEVSLSHLREILEVRECDSQIAGMRGEVSPLHASFVHLSRALRLRRREYRSAAQTKIKAAREARKMWTRQAARGETKKASAVFRYVLRDEFEKTSGSSHFRDFCAKR